MAKNTQAFILFNMLKAAGDKGVSRTQVAKALNVKETSVPVYFFGMKKLYKAEIETVKQGRQVVAYKLLNPDEVTGVPQTRGSGKKSVTKPIAKKSKVVTKPVKKAAKKTGETKVVEKAVAPDADLQVTEITDSEFADIKSSLGL
jgi:hypothetical protein